MALNNLAIPDMFDVTAEFFTDVLANFAAFFTNGDFESLATILSGGSAQGYVAMLRAGDFDSTAMAFARLLFAYGDAFVQDLAKKVQDPNYSRIMRHMVELLGCQGYAGAEDEVCSQSLEFWTTFTEFLTDSLYAAGDEITFWMNDARQYVPEVIEACWKKILMPPPNTVTAWNSEERASFSAFRSDVEDFLQSSFTFLGIDILEQFANLALASLSNRAWLQLEATLFCLNALSDSLPDDDSSDGALCRLFGSSLFVDMVGPYPIPPKTRQTAVNSITNYTAFFERRTEFLPPMLNFLFESLKAPLVANVAAKAIYSTCWTCRKSLVTELAAFLRQYEILLTWDSVEITTKAKVMGAIAAIIQALPSDEVQVNPLNMLLLFVEKDVESFLDLMETGQQEAAQTHGLCALRCLSYMATAFQLPDDVAIDLDAETQPSTVWGQTTGELIQGRIIGSIDKVTSLTKGNGDIMEVACHILRAGYKESDPGPFVLPVFVTERFVVSGDLQTARLDHILDTAGALLSRHANSPTDAVNSAALTFLIHILRLIRQMEGNPSADPEIAFSCLNLAEKLIPTYLQTFLDAQTRNDIPTLFVFSLRCLALPEVMPKRAASYFWASLMQNRELSDEKQNVVNDIMQTYGSQLSYVLIMNVGGGAARSDLDVLADPLRKLVSSHPRAKTWLTDALWSQNFPSQKVGDSDKRIWLQKIINLRGAKGTNQVVKEFWMACRGTNLSYAS
ncbi:hypothetical protein MMC07_007719 [Pseudocyphellaria aurata]|nr:hypothetical protein [Pseudocyphellaria aurata]